MLNPRLSLTLCFSMLPAVAFAAETKEGSAGPSTLRATVPMISSNAKMESAASAGTAEDLPDRPEAELPVLSFHAVPHANAAAMYKRSRLTFGTPQSRGISPLASMPLATTALRMGAQRFNMDDGSMHYDFAICYRMSSRSSIEVIPGDPAPVKLPIHKVANNTGVTVGLVLRLSK